MGPVEADAVRADRLLVIMAHLSIERRLSAPELARRLEVSVRTIYRDIDALCQAGVPVVSEAGLHGGFSLPMTSRAIHGWLSQTDVEALILTHTATPWRELGLAAAREQACLKLLGGLPQPHRARALRLRERVLLDQAGWFADEESNPFMAALQDAVLDDRAIEVTYERRLGQPCDYQLEPYALVFKAGVWYLVAAHEGRWKAFRTSRLVRVEVAGRCFLRDPGFRLPAFWEAFMRDFETGLPRYQATVRVAPGLLPTLPDRAGESVRAPARDAATDPATGWKTLRLTFDSEEQAASAVLALGSGAEALDPPGLRREVAAQAQGIAARYAAGRYGPAGLQPIAPSSTARARRRVSASRFRSRSAAASPASRGPAPPPRAKASIPATAGKEAPNSVAPSRSWR